MYSHEDLVNNQRFMYTYDSTGRLVRQNVLDSSKKRIYDAEYGYDLNNNVSKFTSSAGGVSMTGVRHKNGSTTTDYYFVCNWRGNIISIFGGAVEDELLMGR